MFKKPDIKNVLKIARDAGAIIMSYRGQVGAEYKSDNSPVTKADKESSALVMNSLKALTPDIPVISEEEPMEKNREILKNNDSFWLVDPLDGTKTFLTGYDGFGVHMALIHKGEPVMGVAYFPALNDGEGALYFTGNDGKAYLQVGDQAARVLSAPCQNADTKTVRGALGHNKKQDVAFLNSFNVAAVRAVGGGRLCITAEGKAEIAIFSVPMSYWDIAAGHAILKAAGGELYKGKSGKPVKYDSQKLYVRSCYGAHKKVYETCVQKKSWWKRL